MTVLNITEDNAITAHLTRWYTILGLTIVTYFVFNTIRLSILKYRLGAKTATNIPEGKWFGISFISQGLARKANGDLLEGTRKIYVDNNVTTFQVSFLGNPVLFTKEPKNVQDILATHFEDFVLGERHGFFKPLLGDGIFTLDGAGWKHSRALLRPQFSRDQIGRVQMIEPHVQTLLKQIRRHNGGTFDIQELFFRFTVDTATEALFGASVYCLRDQHVDEAEPPIDFEGKKLFAEAFNVAQAYLATRAFLPKLGHYYYTPEMNRSIKIVHDFAKFYVHKALNTPVEKLSRDEGYIFLYELVKETRDPQVLQDQLLNIMIAGRDTTAGLMSFTMYELSRNPEIYKKLRDAVDEAFGVGSDARLEDMNFESLKRCTYLKYVLNEVLRMYPAVPINFRYPTKDTTLPLGGGPDGLSKCFVQKGQTIVYNAYSMHREPSIYGDDSMVFRPERWAEPGVSKLGWAYLPFNGGPRICLGQQFALIEASYTISRLVQHFETLDSFNNDEYPPPMNSQLTLSLKEGVLLRAK